MREKCGDLDKENKTLCVCVCARIELERLREAKDSHTDKVRGASPAESRPPPGAPLGFGELHATSSEQARVSDVAPQAEAGFVLV